MSRRRAIAQRIRDVRPSTLDWLLALSFLVAIEIEIGIRSPRFEPGDLPTQLSALAATLPLAWRRRAPVAATAVVMAGLIAQIAIEGDSLGLSLLAAVVIVWSTARHFDRRTALASLGIAIGAFWIASAVPPTSGAQYVIGDALWGSSVLGGSWALGRAFRSRRLRAHELEERADHLEREQEAQARAAVADERGRIARELHDIVAHNVSTMVVQAGAGKRVMESDPDGARKAFESIERSGRQALAEMRRLLGILRTDREGLALAPQPGLEHLEALISHVESAGLPVELTVVGEPQPLPSGIDVSAYRIIQEGLTNAIKHAGPAHAEVVVRYGDRELQLEILDDGQGAEESMANGAQQGHGLVGMRERVNLYDGTLETGSREGRGYAVRARLPMEPSVR
jgi:signal transduction histidine kinase